MSESPQNWNKLTVAQLKEELTTRGLDTAGKKQDLVDRLKASENVSKDEPMDDGEGAAEAKEEALDGEEQMEGEAEGEGGEEVDEAALLGGEDEESKEAEANGEGEGAEAAEGAEGGDGDKAEEKEEEQWEDPDTEDVDTFLKMDLEVPKKEDMRRDRTREFRFRRVFAWPLEFDDFKNAVLQKHVPKCQFFTFRTLERANNKDFTESQGSLELQFRKMTDANEAAEELKTIREGIETKQMGPEDSEKATSNRENPFYDLIKGDKNEELAERTLYVKELPAEVTDDTVESLFPTALQVLISREHKDEENKCKGYAYVEYTTREESMKAYAESQELELPVTVTIKTKEKVPPTEEGGEETEIEKEETKEEMKKLTVVHYGNQLVLQGLHDIPEEKKTIEGVLSETDRWFFYKVWRSLKSRLAKDNRSHFLNPLEKKIIIKRIKFIQERFENDNKARVEADMKKKKLPEDLRPQRRPNWGQGGYRGGRGGGQFAGQKRPRPFNSPGGMPRGKMPRRGGPPSLMDMPRGRGGRGGYNNRNAMNLLMGLSDMMNRAGGYPQGGGGGGYGGQGGWNRPGQGQGGWNQGGGFRGQPRGARGGRGGGFQQRRW